MFVTGKIALIFTYLSPVHIWSSYIHSHFFPTESAYHIYDLGQLQFNANAECKEINIAKFDPKEISNPINCE